jgi:adenosylcobyric acid synthase
MTSSVFTLALVAYPHASDLDEFDALAQVPGVAVVRATTREQVHEAECIVLPGSSDVTADLAWLRRGGLDSAIAQHGAARRPVLGVGGGMQLLGEALIDPAAIAGNAPGLGLLAIVSLIEPAAPPTPVQLSFAPVIAHWSPLGGLQVAALEAHQGRSVQHQGMGAARVVLPGGLGWQNAEGNVLGLLVRGLFEDAAVLQALFGAS